MSEHSLSIEKPIKKTSAVERYRLLSRINCLLFKSSIRVSQDRKAETASSLSLLYIYLGSQSELNCGILSSDRTQKIAPNNMGPPLSDSIAGLTTSNPLT